MERLLLILVSGLVAPMSMGIPVDDWRRREEPEAALG